MKTKKISESEILNLKVSSLPTRPTAPLSFGGKGYSARDMKEAFDKLPLFIVERFNSLIDDIVNEDKNSIADSIKTEISEGHTLRELFLDIKNGKFASYLKVSESSLLSLISEIKFTLDKMKKDYENFDPSAIQYDIDCGTPEQLELFIQGGGN